MQKSTCCAGPLVSGSKFNRAITLHFRARCYRLVVLLPLHPSLYHSPSQICRLSTSMVRSLPKDHKFLVRSLLSGPPSVKACRRLEALTVPFPPGQRTGHLHSGRLDVRLLRTRFRNLAPNSNQTPWLSHLLHFSTCRHGNGQERKDRFGNPTLKPTGFFFSSPPSYAPFDFFNVQTRALMLFLLEIYREPKFPTDRRMI